MESVDLLVRGGLTLTVDAERRVFRSGALAVRAGRIVWVGDATDATFSAAETVDATESIILPGFVNSHSHLIGGFVRGLGGDQFVNVAGSAADRLSNRLREAMDEEACYAGARLALLELQRSGVTTAADSQPGLAGKGANLDGTLRAIRESRIRALFTRASLNRSEYVSPEFHDSLDRAIPELERLHGRWADDRVEVAAEAQALHRVEEDLLKGLKAWTRQAGVHFAMHISYSREAAEHAVERFGRRLLLLLDEWGVLDERFLGYHPVWLTSDEIAAIARTGAGVAFCPVDNMLIASGVAPIPALLGVNARLGLGIDQPNDGHNFFELMKLSVLMQRQHQLDPTFGSPELALELGTIGGARALHREAQIGSLEVGKAADFVMLDARRPALNPFSGRLSNIVYASSPADIDSVYIAGQPVIRGGRHLIWDEEEVVREANRAMAGCLTRSGVDPKAVPFSRWAVLG